MELSVERGPRTSAVRGPPGHQAEASRERAREAGARSECNTSIYIYGPEHHPRCRASSHAAAHAACFLRVSSIIPPCMPSVHSRFSWSSPRAPRARRVRRGRRAARRLWLRPPVRLGFGSGLGLELGSGLGLGAGLGSGSTLAAAACCSQSSAS